MYSANIEKIKLLYNNHLEFIKKLKMLNIDDNYVKLIINNLNLIDKYIFEFKLLINKYKKFSLDEYNSLIYDNISISYIFNINNISLPKIKENNLILKLNKIKLKIISIYRQINSTIDKIRNELFLNEFDLSNIIEGLHKGKNQKNIWENMYNPIFNYNEDLIGKFGILIETERIIYKMSLDYIPNYLINCIDNAVLGKCINIYPIIGKIIDANEIYNKNIDNNKSSSIIKYIDNNKLTLLIKYSKHNEINKYKILKFDAFDKNLKNFFENNIEYEKYLSIAYNKFAYLIQSIYGKQAYGYCRLTNCCGNKNGFIDYNHLFKNNTLHRKCIYCEDLSCIECGNDIHINNICPIINNLYSTIENKELIKICPTCQKFIEKNEGCNHILCIYCKTHWCWKCSMVLNDIDPYDHINNCILNIDK